MTMITITLNGEPRSLAENCQLSAALTEWGYEAKTYAVAVNETFVPRSQYDQHTIREGDRVDVVSPLEGG